MRSGKLLAIAADASHPAIARATALVQFNGSESQRALETFLLACVIPIPCSTRSSEVTFRCAAQ
jgi:hypothetical protein